MASLIKATGLICSRANIPETCEWEDALLVKDLFEDYLLLDSNGFKGIRRVHSSWFEVNYPNWVEVSFEELSKYYSVYLLGIDPIATYNEVHNVLP